MTNRYCSSGLPTSSNESSGTVKEDFARIKYQVGGRGDYHFCRHVVGKYHGSGLIDGTSYYSSTVYPDYNPGYGAYASRVNHHHLYFPSLIGYYGKPMSLNMSALNAEAFEGMQPDLVGEFALTNFLLELPDIRRIGNMFESLSSKHSRIRRAAKRLSRGKLTWDFGVKPLVSDLRNLYQLLTSYRSRITDFLALRGEPQVRHWKKEFSESDEFEDVSWYKRFTHYLVMKGYTCYTMRYTYDCPDIQTTYDELMVLCDMLGLRLTPDVVWEALPYSFVVDWIFRVGDWLKQFNKPNWPVELTVLDYLETVKCEFTHTVLYECSEACVSGTNYVHGGTLGEYRGKYYLRQHVVPNSGTAFINQGQYGPNQLALSAALIFR